MCLCPIRISAYKKSPLSAYARGVDIEPSDDSYSLLGTPRLASENIEEELLRVVDHHLPFYIVPCGKCIECCNKRKSEWYVRLRRQIECGAYQQVYWCSWTFDDDHLPSDRKQLASIIRKYIDRMRKHYGYSPNYWMITERGEDDKYTKRLHLHGFLMFQHDRPSYEELKELWSCGFLWVQELDSLKGVTYSMKYVFKNAVRRLEGDSMVSVIFCSKGIGSAYLMKWSYRFDFYNDPTFVPFEDFGTCYKYSLPRYIRKRVEIFARGRPEISPYMLLCQVLGVTKITKPLSDHIRDRYRTMVLARRAGDVYSRYILNVHDTVRTLLYYYPDLKKYE